MDARTSPARESPEVEGGNHTEEAATHRESTPPSTAHATLPETSAQNTSGRGLDRQGDASAGANTSARQPVNTPNEAPEPELPSAHHAHSAELASEPLAKEERAQNDTARAQTDTAQKDVAQAKTDTANGDTAPSRPAPKSPIAPPPANLGARTTPPAEVPARPASENLTVRGNPPATPTDADAAGPSKAAGPSIGQAPKAIEAEKGLSFNEVYQKIMSQKAICPEDADKPRIPQPRQVSLSVDASFPEDGNKPRNPQPGQGLTFVFIFAIKLFFCSLPSRLSAPKMQTSRGSPRPPDPQPRQASCPEDADKPRIPQPRQVSTFENLVAALRDQRSLGDGTGLSMDLGNSNGLRFGSGACPPGGLPSLLSGLSGPGSAAGIFLGSGDLSRLQTQGGMGAFWGGSGSDVGANQRGGLLGLGALDKNLTENGMNKRMKLENGVDLASSADASGAQQLLGSLGNQAWMGPTGVGHGGGGGGAGLQLASRQEGLASASGARGSPDLSSKLLISRLMGPSGLGANQASALNSGPKLSAADQLEIMKLEKENEFLQNQLDSMLAQIAAFHKENAMMKSLLLDAQPSLQPTDSPAHSPQKPPSPQPSPQTAQPTAHRQPSPQPTEATQPTARALLQSQPTPQTSQPDNPQRATHAHRPAQTAPALLPQQLQSHSPQKPTRPLGQPTTAPPPSPNSPSHTPEPPIATAHPSDAQP
eukprot:gene3571-13650_t